MEREIFFKKAIDILLDQEFYGEPLFTSGDMDDYVVGDEENAIPLSEFLDELCNHINRIK